MENRNEMLADVLAEMRKEIGDGTDTYLGMRIIRRMEDTRVRHYCDRIEAAWKRDEEHAVEHATRHAEAVARDNCRDCIHNPLGPNYKAGNAAKLRETLERVEKLVREFAVGNYYVSDFPKMLLDAIQPALSAPPRNCDVGTAEEQNARHNAFCYRMMKKNNHCCGPCPCFEFVDGEAQACTLLWGQMPYEEGGAR